MRDDLLVVQKRVPRWGGYDRVTGAAKYTVDIQLPGMLVGKILTSPYAHANILRVDKSKARVLPGVEAVISFEDIPKKRFIPSKHHLTLFPKYHPESEIMDMYVLTDKVRFFGDKVAAVAAVDESTAQEALRLIEVEYEVLENLFDPREAVRPGAPRIHEFAENNIPLEMHFPGSKGDVAQGFGEADCVVEDTFWSSKQQMSQLEPCSCVASFAADGRLTIWSPNQSVFLHKTKIAEIFDLPEGMIHWITPHVGGSFGKYGSLGAEPVCIALARATGKPVKVEYSREEDFFGTEARQTFVTTAKVGVSKEGTMVALSEQLISDSGAYFSRSKVTSLVNMGSFTGLYRCANTAAHLQCIYTNTPTTGGVRGYGNSEGTCALEQLVDRAATGIGMDPIELRLKNVKKAGDLSNSGLPMSTCSLEQLIKLGAEKIGWREKRAREKQRGDKRYGIGMAIMMDVSGAYPSNIQNRNAYIKFNTDGSVNLMVMAYDMGQNLAGTCAQIAAEALGLHYEDVHVIMGDTDTTMFDTGVQASAGCYQMGNGVMQAALNAKRRLLQRAAKMMGRVADELDVRDRRVYVKNDPSVWIEVGTVTRSAMYNFEGEHENISAKGTFFPSENPPPFAAVFAEVEVDVQTGEVDILKILYVNDSGTAINPATVEGQIEGGVAQAIGYCLTEEFVVDRKSGRLLTDNFTTYKMPAALDMPEIEVVLYQEPVPSGPFGAKAVGHGTNIAVSPAIANAIYDAVGVCITQMPATPERILKAMKESCSAKVPQDVLCPV
jgi:xanthine dehydrogenase molybdenum-binding subunit